MQGRLGIFQGGSLDLNIWRERFADWLKTRYPSKDTINNYTRGLEPFLVFIDGHRPSSWSDVNRDWLEEFRNHLFAHRTKTGRALANGTVTARLLAVKTFFRFLVQQGFLMASPAAYLELPRVTKPLPSVLTEAEMICLLNTPNLRTRAGIRNRAILEMLYGTGIRNHELVALRLGDVDAHHGFVRLPKAKGNKPRVVPIGQEALHWLNRYLEEVRPFWLRNPSLDSIFLDRWGHNALSGQGLSNLVREICVQTALGKRITPHTLRHSCATHMLRNGAGLRQVQELLGHSQITSTEHYTRVEVSDLRKTLARCHPRERQ